MISDTGDVPVADRSTTHPTRLGALAVAGVVATLGCSAPSGPTTEGGESGAAHQETVTASPELDELARQAVERWSAATGRDWVYLGAVPADTGADFHLQIGAPPEGFVAFAYANGRIVVSPDWIATPELGSILMHELGHAFRGDHHDGPGVMYYGIGDGVMTPCLTPADLLWACQQYDCGRFTVECEQPVVPAVEPARRTWALCPLEADRAGSAPRLHPGG